MKSKLQWGASGDAILLTLIKLVTIALSFAVTRLLSQFLSLHDYGTYSQILLIVSTVTSVTILGMADGVNYFYCSQKDEASKEKYISTIYTLQCIISTVAGATVMVLANPICRYFDNPDVKRLLIFAAALPLFQNLLSMTQVLLVSVGKARMLALRNLIVSLVRLAAVIAVIAMVKDVALILSATLLMDVAQMVLFLFILRKNRCAIRWKCADFKLFGTIFSYCAPMAVFTLLNTLNRDCDKYLIGLMTDTETLAMYSNASKVLPFDLIASSFMTVLLPQVTRHIASGQKQNAMKLYRAFLEITYISTTILCCAVLAASPQVMQLLYSEKYLAGFEIFCVYVLVDLLRFTNITLILSAAGKTKKLMFFSLGALVTNALLNIVLFRFFGIIGPAAATLITSVLLGLCMMNAGAKELDGRISGFFDLKYLLRFIAGSAVFTAILWLCQSWLAAQNLPYLIVLVLIVGVYALVTGLICRKRFLRAIRQVNALSKTL